MYQLKIEHIAAEENDAVKAGSIQRSEKKLGVDCL